MSLPRAPTGTVGLRLVAELTEVDRDRHGIRLVRLVVPSAAHLIDRNSLHHVLRRPHDIHTHPGAMLPAALPALRAHAVRVVSPMCPAPRAVYFRQRPSGELLELLHHPSETAEALSMKREMISAHQLVGLESRTVQRRHRRRTTSTLESLSSLHGFDSSGFDGAEDADGSGGTWRTLESDAGGTGRATYAVGAHGRRKLWSVRKAFVYEDDAADDDGGSAALVRREVNTSAVFDRKRTLHSIRQRAYVHPMPHAPESAEMRRAGARVQSITGREFWPRTPTQTTWSLLAVRPATAGHAGEPCADDDGLGTSGRRCRRALHDAVALVRRDFVRAPITNPEPGARPATPPPERKRSCDPSAMGNIPPSCRGLDCAIEVALQAKACPGYLVRVEAWIATHCQGRAVANCGPMFNALGMVANADVPHAVQAQHMLAHHLPRTSLDSLPRSAIVAVGTLREPSSDLLATLSRLIPNGSPRRAAHARRSLMLAAAAAAGRAQRRGPLDAAAHAAVSNISHSVLGHHEAVLDADRRWIARHTEAASSADAIWARMSHHARQAWTAHHHQLRADSLRWAIDQGKWASHEAEAREALAFQCLERAPDYDADEETEHYVALVASVHALGELRHAHPHHLRLVHHALRHRSQPVVQAAAEALRHLPHATSEAALLELVRTSTDRHVLKMALRTMRRWHAIGDESVHRLFDEWARRWKAHGEMGGGGAVDCVATCVRRRCNPHAHRRRCSDECSRQCEEDSRTRDELRDTLAQHTAGRTTWYDPDAYEHHPTHLGDVAAASHGHGHGGGTMAVASPPHLPTMAAAANRSQFGGRGGPVRTPEGRGRRRLFDWSKVDFDQLSLTFVDLQITLPGNLNVLERAGFEVAPLGKFFGIEIKVDIENSGWLRIGLFGGGFGVRFIDEGSALLYPGFSVFEMFYAGFRFKCAPMPPPHRTTRHRPFLPGRATPLTFTMPTTLTPRQV